MRAAGAGRTLPVCSAHSTAASPAKAAPRDEVSFGSSRRVVSLPNWGSQSSAMVALEVFESTEMRDRRVIREIFVLYPLPWLREVCALAKIQPNKPTNPIITQDQVPFWKYKRGNIFRSQPGKNAAFIISASL